MHMHPPSAEDCEVDEGGHACAWAAYHAQGGGGDGRGPVYSSELGLAVEAPRDGATLAQLWSVL